jgi:hypothetical protein
MVGGVAVCLASWLALLAGTGNLGIQRSVSIGPLTLLERPVALVAVAGMTLAVAMSVGYLMRSTSAIHLVTLILLFDIAAAVVIAPVMIGELTPRDAPMVFIVIAALGLQPMAAYVGVIAGQLAAAPRA